MSSRAILLTVCLSVAGPSGLCRGEDAVLLPGLRGQYATRETKPRVVFERLDREISFDGSMHLPPGGDRRLRVTWTGELRIPSTGAYTFRDGSNDGMRLRLGDMTVLDSLDRDDNSPRLVSATVELREGYVPIEVAYENRRDDPRVQLQWLRPGQEKEETVPVQCLRTRPWSGMSVYERETLAAGGRTKEEDYEPGWRGRYFADTHFRVLFHEQLDPMIRYANHYPTPNGRKENISVRWTSALPIEREGEYTFYATSDDGQRLWIDHRLVIDNFDSQSATEKTATVRLDRGPHTILYEHYQGTGDSHAKLEWSGPDIERRLLDDRYVRSRAWRGMIKRRPMVVLLALGHSNMEGRARKGLDKPSPRTWMYDPDRHSWRRCTNHDRGPMAPLLDELAGRYPGFDFGCLKVARSAARVASNYRRGKREFDLLVRATRSLPRSARVVGLVAMQGYCEGASPRGKNEAAQFGDQYRAMINELRGDLERPTLPVLVSQIEWDTNRKRHLESWEAIEKHLYESAAQLDHAEIVESKDLGLVDDHHFNRDGNIAWAKRAADVVDSMGWLEGIEPVEMAVHEADEGDLPPPDQVVAEVEAVVHRHTPGRSLRQLGAYRNLLVVTEYRLKQVRKGKLRAKTFLAVHMKFRDRKATDAARFVDGQVHRLRLADWRAQPKRVRQMPLDDATDNLDAPIYFTLGVDVEDQRDR